MIKEPSIFAIVDSSMTLIDWAKTQAMAQAIVKDKMKCRQDEYSIIEYGWNGWDFVLIQTLEPNKGVKNAEMSRC